MLTKKEVVTVAGRAYVVIERDGKTIARVRPDYYTHYLGYALATDDIKGEESGDITIATQFKVNRKFILEVRYTNMDLREVYKYVHFINEYPSFWRDKLAEYWESRRSQINFLVREGLYITDIEK